METLTRIFAVGCFWRPLCKLILNNVEIPTYDGNLARVRVLV